MSEENLNVLFENNFDCYTGFANEELNVEEQMAMTKDKFIEIVTPLINTRQPPESKKIEGALEGIAYLEGVLSFSDSEIIKKHVVRLGLDRIKSTLKGGE